MRGCCRTMWLVKSTGAESRMDPTLHSATRPKAAATGAGQRPGEAMRDSSGA